MVNIVCSGVRGERTKKIQSQSKIAQKSTKNQSKIQPKSAREASGRRLGGVLEAKVSPVPILELRGGQPGSSYATTPVPKSLKNRTQKLYKFQSLSESIFSSILIPKMDPEGLHDGCFFGLGSFTDFQRMSLTKH